MNLWPSRCSQGVRTSVADRRSRSLADHPSAAHAAERGAARLASAIFVVAVSMPFTSAVAAQSAPGDTVRQRDVIDLARSLFHKPPDTTAIDTAATTKQRAILPTLGASPTDGFKFGASVKSSFRNGDPATTNVSTWSTGAFATTKKQFGLTSNGSIFTKDNTWNLSADWRYLNSNQPTYGLGNLQPADSIANMKFQYIRLQQAVYREVGQQLLIGGGYSLSWYFHINDQDAVNGRITPYLEYNGGKTVTQSISSGPTLAMLYDSRDNPLNASRGAYAFVQGAVFPTWLGSDDNWQQFSSDLRWYFRPSGSSRSTLALWSYTWLTFGHAPYMDLPATGWDRAGRLARGYPAGRIRGSKMLYGEAEYRLALSRDGLWGMVGFASLTSVTGTTGSSFNAPDPAAGVGLRVKLNKHNDTNITLDYAWGRDAKGFFLGSAEAF